MWSVIVGGGLAGLSIAYCLSQSGKKVVVVEDGLIGSGETGRTTAHLVTALDDHYYDLERIFGEEKIKLIAESHQIILAASHGTPGTRNKILHRWHTRRHAQIGIHRR